MVTTINTDGNYENDGYDDDVDDIYNVDMILI